LRALGPFQGDGSSTAIRYRVSSAHLTLASTVFRSMLKGCYEESRKNSQGLYEITAEEWDAEALLVVLDLIHGHNKSVPRSVSTNTLERIAIIVDYYRCHESMQFAADLWISSPTIRYPVDFGEHSVTWLFIAWVFSWREVFEAMTLVSITMSEGLIETDLPIPISILRSIETHRQGLISEICEKVYDLVERLWNEPPSKTATECHSTFLGSLLKQIRASGLPYNHPVKPFQGLSATKYSEMVSSMYSPRSCSTNKTPSTHICRLGPEVQYKVKELIRNAKGLQLDMFGYNIQQKDLPTTMLVPLLRIEE
jgi:hypothetical protein